eukprot:423771_1
MMSKKSTDIAIEKVIDVNDYFMDNYDYLKKLPDIGSNKGIHCFEAILFNGSRHFIKKCSKPYISETNIDNPWNEINALQIISLIKSQYFPAFINAIEDDKYICLISEYIDGVDLFDTIKKQNGNGLSIHKAQRYLIQLSYAIGQLHKHNLAHLDLSTENIIIDKNDNIRLIDFGVCSEIIPSIEEKCIYYSDEDNEQKQKKDDNLTYNKHIRSRLLPGKDGYRAPEIEQRKECDPKLADAFSFGYIAWTCICGNFPFENAHPKNEIYKKFMTYGAEKWINMLSESTNGWDYNQKDINKNKIPMNAIQMLDQLLECNVYKRKSIQDLLKDNTSFLHEMDEKKSDEIKMNVENMKKIDIKSTSEIDVPHTDWHTKVIGVNFQLSH